MSEPIVVIDRSEVREGKLEELNHEGTRMIVLQVHPDSASMAFHMCVAAPAFAKFGEPLPPP
jgi:hypothetical protein